ncbi:hypothetical protein [uncultured Ruegeria sp.]|uniref:hypothetical protein n=1 Tax=uncultured Ruegeria sp. TaxID=259304 RepID=UPI002631A492|nr:hypothetical protein [uncultured Ruegeria sp.]
MMKRSLFLLQPVALVLALICVAAAPAHAGWLNDAIGDFVRETLADSIIVGVTVASIGFIWGLLAYIFGWGSLKLPIAAVLIGVVITLAPSFIGG